MELFRETLPQVVILDLEIPGGTGLEVLAVVKKERPKTTVIVLTNYAMCYVRTRCCLAGADYFFDKSTEFERVVSVLESLKEDVSS